MCYLCDDVIPDRIGGDDDRVRAHAKAFDDTARALRQAAVELGNLANEGVTISVAIDEVREKASEATSNASAVATRYQGAATTLTNYAGALADVQSRVDTARNHMDTNNSNARYWRHRRRELEQDRWTRGSDPEFLDDLAEAVRRSAQYDTWFAGYLSDYQRATQDFETAVTNAVSGLASAAEAAGLNDNFFEAIAGDFQVAWELISEYLGPVIAALRDIMEIIKKIVDVLALIVTIAAIFFPALGPIALALSALSAVLGIAIFAASLVLFLMGRETLGRVIADGIMAVVGVVATKLGGSGTLGAMMKDGIAAVRTPAALFVTRGTMINLGLAVGGESAQRYGQAVAEFAVGGIQSGTLSANVTPIAFVVGEGLDFQLGQTSPAWGADASPAWDMSGADGREMLPGLMDSPTLGMTSPIAGMFDVSESWNSMIANFGEVGDTWSQMYAVPAT
ncbi:MAG: hypothetical protein DI534_06405 [Leifsonia xyli]|nr:MAG: hypothetical protein DI534_06405 [Leifsonia xyli]